MDNFFKKHRKVADLIYYDGPLLSLFTDKHNGGLYLLKWVDVDNEEHVWLKFQVRYSLLIDYLKKVKTEYELIKSSEEINIITVKDDLTITSTKMVSFEQLEPSFLPDKDVFFDESLSLETERSVQFVELFRKRALLKAKRGRRTEYLKTHNIA